MTAVTSVVASPATGEEGVGHIITISLNMSGNVTVSGGTPKLILNDDGVAVYDAAKSTTTSLVFDYTVAGGQTTQNLTVASIFLNGASITDSSGNNADLSGALTTFTGLQISDSLIGLAFNPQSQAYEVISVNPTTGSVTSLIRALSGVQYLGSGEAAAGNDIYFTGGAIVTDPMTGVGGFGPESLFTADISTGALTSVPVPRVLRSIASIALQGK